MAIRMEVDIAFNCRPKRGERRAKDGSGRLVKASLYFGEEGACIADARKAREAGARIAPGYSETVETRFYDAVAFKADPLRAKPYRTVSGPV